MIIFIHFLNLEIEMYRSFRQEQIPIWVKVQGLKIYLTLLKIYKPIASI